MAGRVNTDLNACSIYKSTHFTFFDDVWSLVNFGRSGPLHLIPSMLNKGAKRMILLLHLNQSNRPNRGEKRMILSLKFNPKKKMSRVRSCLKMWTYPTT